MERRAANLSKLNDQLLIQHRVFGFRLALGSAYMSLSRERGSMIYRTRRVPFPATADSTLCREAPVDEAPKILPNWSFLYPWYRIFLIFSTTSPEKLLISDGSNPMFLRVDCI